MYNFKVYSALTLETLMLNAVQLDTVCVFTIVT